MISIEISKDNGSIKEISFKGHALYDDYGKDIVCAAVSSILITTVNGILRLDSKALKVYEDSETKVSIINSTKIVNTLINNMIDLLTELEKKYKKNIKIKYKEVS